MTASLIDQAADYAELKSSEHRLMVQRAQPDRWDTRECLWCGWRGYVQSCTDEGQSDEAPSEHAKATVERDRALWAKLACWCLTCRPVTMTDMRMVLCPDCGNKRCPKATNHRHVCTGSNEPGQPGSVYA